MHDVVIVGAGPVGLFLACELGLAGCSVMVIERELEGPSPWRAQPLGMRGLSAASIQAFDRRGLLEPLLPVGGGDELPATRMVGHFAGMMVDAANLDEAAFPFRLPSPVPDILMTSLEVIETVLAERAVKLGVEIHRGTAVSGVTQYDESVVVRAGDQEYEARWVVGCDGGRSVVRGLAGFEFVGTEPQLTGYTMHATVAGLDKLRPGFNVTAAGMYIRMRTDSHFSMLDFDGGAFDRSQPLTRDHLQAVLRRVSGTDVTLTDLHLASSFTDRAMQTTTYRRGRVLLAGDAAHIHSPLGGQGLNTGLGDAMNLGWKLAATVQGSAPDGLLDSYTSERHPIGASVLDWTRAQVDVMRPGPQAQAIQGVIRDLLGTRDGTTYIVDKLSGSWIRYDLGGEHPLVGRSAPDFQLEDGTRLRDLMQDGRGVLLDFTGNLKPTWDVRYVAGPAKNDLGLDAVLIRPDGFVAWTGDQETFDEAAGRWFRQVDR
ncbi:FAD-dependent monooxygenase [Kribbella kalugense]|uniref:2-polyprenyl-6-methoxyphenol hydroxylase-like FAD-dependent oxidoreductase n=1 Tax=Kribbella kalugense TaxID=2512221 RepID=A0A4R8A0P6_9ACTN|nr:FAD-dependent monooxygenase [Kribbella kalugense]TDW23952.1 2-polyprenyl-6-methoxyphenol hydroxylase-like FAD-dependent oxidoreductase [Kribbella kalugense]